MGWKITKDNKSGASHWQITDRKIIDRKLCLRILNVIGKRRREIRAMTLDQVMLQKGNLCVEEKKLWLQKYLGKQRIPYVDDREILVINRDNLVQESFDAFQTFIDLNLHKEL